MIKKLLIWFGLRSDKVSEEDMILAEKLETDHNEAKANFLLFRNLSWLAHIEYFFNKSSEKRRDILFRRYYREGHTRTLLNYKKHNGKTKKTS